MKLHNCHLILLVTAVLLPLGAHAQRGSVLNVPKLDELPAVVIDTINTADPETRIILYSNNTFKYYRPAFEKRYSGMPVFNEHWDTAQVFAYKSMELKDLPDQIDMRLISSIGEFCPPYTGDVRYKYGPRGRRNHNGVDISLKRGDPIHAAFDGKVRYSSYNTGGFGNLVIIRHANGLETWHGHMSKRNVKVNDYVKAGDVIGYGGSTGRSTGNHLHFEVRYCDQTFDPERLFAFEDGGLKYQTFVLEKSFFSIRSRETDQLEEYDNFDMLASLKNEEGEEASAEDILAYMSEAETAKREAETRKSQEIYHTIKRGDVLGAIAGKYGVTVSQICKLNNITPTTIIRAGNSLRIK